MKKKFCGKSGSEALFLYGSDDIPVGNVDQFDAVRYCNWLSEMTGRRPAYTINRDDK
jgi:formylglycine-generating enzyme required for sulfatase activity